MTRSDGGTRTCKCSRHLQCATRRPSRGIANRRDGTESRRWRLPFGSETFPKDNFAVGSIRENPGVRHAGDPIRVHCADALGANADKGFQAKAEEEPAEKPRVIFHVSVPGSKEGVKRRPLLHPGAAVLATEGRKAAEGQERDKTRRLPRCFQETADLMRGNGGANGSVVARLVLGK